MLKFLAPQNVPSGGVGSAGNAEPTDVRVHLLPVLQTMLQLSAEGLPFWIINKKNIMHHQKRCQLEGLFWMVNRYLNKEFDNPTFPTRLHLIRPEFSLTDQQISSLFI